MTGEAGSLSRQHDPSTIRAVLGRLRRGRRPGHALSGAVAMLAPFLILLAVFQYGPITSALWTSLHGSSVQGEFVGAANYITILGESSFQESLARTGLFMAFKFPLQILVGLGLAVFTYRNTRLNNLLRSAAVLPMAIAMVVVSLMFGFLFDTELGLINAFLAEFGFERVDWLTNPLGAQLVVLILSVWRDTGLVLLVFLSGLNAIPGEIYEAAEVDGAGPVQTFLQVTIPLLVRSFQFVAVFTVVASAQLVSPVHVLTQGGPQRATSVASYEVYREAFEYFDWARSSAMAVLVLVLILLLSALIIRSTRADWAY